MVPHDDIAREAGRRTFARAGNHAMHDSMSAIRPNNARELADLHSSPGQGSLSAPVLGNPDPAAARKLSIRVWSLSSLVPVPAGTSHGSARPRRYGQRT
ncbi:hypothetical protein E1N52_34825 [Paraburkholderia guartelaensis]|uniref:Uncharacterized protein n=1 Tax=Paraburkholderia guartelaensis TaxID=2546446 RepID=A0A4R5L623_9BURK|nr:hypothetical protein E1N52_34825 [Paraburkholderia guartelaensis]